MKVASLVLAGSLVLGWGSRTFAGAVGNDYERVETGNPYVSGAKVTSQAWRVDAYKFDIELDLTLQATADEVTIAVETKHSKDGEFLFSGSDQKLGETVVPAFAELGLAPAAKALASAGKRVVKADEVVLTSTHRVGIVGKRGEIKVTLKWRAPSGGPGDEAVTKAYQKTFCVDAGTKRAFEGYDGANSVFLNFGNQTDKTTLRITRNDPISVCGTGIRAVNPQTFEAKDVRKLKNPMPLLAARRI